MATEHDAALDVANAYFASWAEGDMHRLRDLLEENALASCICTPPET